MNLQPDTEIIKQNRDFFISYNIAHLRELIRYLSPEKFELFHTLPFLLHVNTPRFPGFIDHPDCRYGIWGFQDSGFWKLALRHFAYREQDLMSCLAKKFYIQGLYLMGSSGTLAQGEHSDLDYWVLVDDTANDTIGIATLRAKLDKLEAWAGKTYRQNVCFFIMTTTQVRDNSFRQVDEESSGTIQQTILKEEFYRTFLMIAGLIPYWAVFPIGLTRPCYDAWIAEMEKSIAYLPDQNYIDLGYPEAIDRTECPGALLWQVYKSRHDPVKSYIKASLIMYYYFSPETETLPCDEIKKKFPDKRLDSYMVDPYSTIFDKTLQFYEVRKDTRRLEMLRECLFLRIHGYPVVKPIEPDSPKNELLQLYLRQWSWDAEKIDRLRNYPNWPEPDKLDYEIRIISRISTLYKEIQSEAKDAAHTKASDLQSIQNRITATFKTRPDKIPRCSAYIKARAEAGNLRLLFRSSSADDGQWTVYDQQAVKVNPHLGGLYTGSGLAGLMGWLDVNKLQQDGPESIRIMSGNKNVSEQKAMAFMDKAFHFLKESSAGCDFTSETPSWNKILVAVEANPSGSNDCFERFDIILKNTWGEIFHLHQAVKDIENNMLKCYKLGNLLFPLIKDSPPEDQQFLIVTLDIEDEGYARKTILDFLHQNRAKQSDVNSNHPKTESVSPGKTGDPETPFLDLL